MSRDRASFFRDGLSRQIARWQYGYMGRPDRVIFFGFGIGDDLLCATLAHELKKRGARRVVMLSKYAELFEGNRDVDVSYPWGPDVVGRLRRWGYPVTTPYYSTSDPEHDRDIFRNEHLLVTMGRLAGITGAIDLRTYLHLTEEERAAGRRWENQVVIQSSGLPVGPGALLNKNWFPDRYQAVVDQLKEDVRFIQLGQLSDPLLAGALDLRGRTTLREAAALLAGSRIFIGQVGFLMHLARAVDCRGVIVYGGREDPAVTGYAANENLVGRTVCSFCWQRSRCDYHHECMQMITVEDVVAAARRQLKLAGQPVKVETANVEMIS